MDGRQQTPAAGSPGLPTVFNPFSSLELARPPPPPPPRAGEHPKVRSATAAQPAAGGVWVEPGESSVPSPQAQVWNVPEFSGQAGGGSAPLQSNEFFSASYPENFNGPSSGTGKQVLARSINADPMPGNYYRTEMSLDWALRDPCPLENSCTIARGQRQLRNPFADVSSCSPSAPPGAAAAFKTVLCNHWKTGACKYGDKCIFAHGEAELQRPAGQYRYCYENAAFKTVLCNHWKTSACKYGDKCIFAHGEAELQRPAGQYRYCYENEVLANPVQSTAAPGEWYPAPLFRLSPPSPSPPIRGPPPPPPAAQPGQRQWTHHRLGASSITDFLPVQPPSLLLPRSSLPQQQQQSGPAQAAGKSSLAYQHPPAKESQLPSSSHHCHPELSQPAQWQHRQGGNHNHPGWQQTTAKQAGQPHGGLNRSSLQPMEEDWEGASRQDQTSPRRLESDSANWLADLAAAIPPLEDANAGMLSTSAQAAAEGVVASLCTLLQQASEMQQRGDPAGLEMLRSYNWDIPEQIMARPDYYNDGTLQALMQESAELISVMAAEQEQKEREEQLLRAQQDQSKQALDWLCQSVKSGDEEAVQSALVVLNDSLESTLLSQLVWMAGSGDGVYGKPTLGVFQALVSCWRGVDFCWTQLRMPAMEGTPAIPERYILHEAVIKEAEDIVEFIVAERRSVLVEICPNDQTGVNALRLAIQLMASPRMVEILSPPDFPDSWERLCGNPPINALQLAQFMCAHNQGDVLAYYKGVYKRLHAKNKAIMDLRASKKSGNHKQMMAGKKVKEEAAPKEATATPSRQQLEQLAGALFMAVEGGREDECREALEFLSKFSCQERAVVIPRAKHLELIWQAGVEIGSVQMLRMLCEFFQAAQASSKFTFRWETHNFAKNAKKPRTILGAALRQQKFDVARAAMEALREAENPSLKKSVAQIIKNDPSWPLVSSISGGAKADMIKLLVLGYEMSGRSFDEMDKEGLTSLGAAILSSDDTEVLRIVANRANLLRPFNNGLTPLWAAVKGGDLDKVCILLDAAMSGQSPLEKEDRKRFLEEKSKGSSPLWLAVSAKSNDIAERLVAAGADVLSRGKNHSTPMHQVLRSCDKDQTPNLLKNMIKSLPEDKRGTLLNAAEDAEGDRILHCAMKAGFYKIANYLVGQGASMVVVNRSFRSPLMMALEAADQVKSGVEPLLAAIQRDWNPSLLQSALVPGMPPEDYKRVIKWLMDNEKKLLAGFMEDRKLIAAMSQEAVDNKNIFLLEILMKQTKFDAADLTLHPLVHTPETDQGHKDILMTLLNAGANVNSRDRASGRTLLHLAVLMQNEPLCKDLLDLENEKSASVIIRDNEGNTPLHLAAMCIQSKDLRDRLCEKLAKFDLGVLQVPNGEGCLPSECSKFKSTKQLLRGLERRSIGKEKAKKDMLGRLSHGGVQDVNGELNDGASQETPEQTVARTQAEAEASGRLFPENETPSMRCIRVALAIKSLNTSDLHQPRGLGKAVSQSIQSAISSVFQGHQALEAPKGVGSSTTLMDADVISESLDDSSELEDPARTLTPMELLAAITEECPWEFVITRDARQEWAKMDNPYRGHVMKRLLRIAQGYWLQDGNTVCLVPEDKSLTGLEMWRTKFSKSGRIVFEVAVDYSQKAKAWQENLRLWVITMNHDKYEQRIKSIEASYRRARDVNQKLKLEADAREQDRVPCRTQRLPRRFHELTEGLERSPTKAKDESYQEPERCKELRDHMPPASAQKDSYTLLKFYDVSQTLLRTVMKGLDDSEVDFPFRVSPMEQSIIEMNPVPPSSILLLGRSGTGKTTCAVYRIWGHWMTNHLLHSACPYHQVFLTASATLKEQVARAFHKLQAAALADSLDVLVDYLHASSEEYATLAQVPDAAFPLFVTTKTFLRMLDGTVKSPFFPRRENGTVLMPLEEIDPDGMGIEIDLDYTGGEDDEEFEDLDDAASSAFGGQRGQEGQLNRGRQEISYQFFVDTMWKKITTKEERAKLKPPLVYQEIMSYLKGSSEAIKAEGCCLTIDDYLAVGRKRAPNFSDEDRKLVYTVFEQYQRHRALLNRFDNMDLVGHIYQSILSQGYRGVPIHSLYRDEVQDFTQAELLLDMRVVADPNSLFYCGDTCQTIARGIGFRFTDIRTLMYDEGQERRRLAQSGKTDVTEIGVPVIHQLKINYRTHSGIIDVASSIVDLIKHYFPRQIDNLERECAFFKGPPPLLLSSLDLDDISILLSGSNRNTSQVEFGAHQVILVRHTASIQRLPTELQESRAIIMTVSQSKGLEFDDVFLVDFFHDSPADEEWRLLSTFLDDLQKDEDSGEGEEVYLPSGRKLQEIPVDASTAGALRRVEFSESRHVLLCEELKHLYTAITRAKNNVVIFDQDERKRAPFYHYLHRCGLARVVKKSLLEDGADASKFGLTKVTNSADEWRNRAANLFDNKLYDLASKSYSTSGDPVRALMAKAMGKLQGAETMRQESTSGKVVRELFYTAGADLLTAVQQASKAPTPVEHRELQRWLKLAVRAFVKAGEFRTAAQILEQMGLPESATGLYSRLGDRAEAARCAEEAAGRFAAEGNAAQASKFRAEAFHQLHLNKDHASCVDMLRKNPAIRAVLPAECDKSLELRLLQLVNGQRQLALEMSALISSSANREKWLRKNGFWMELAQAVADPVEGAELLARLDDYDGAAARLRKSITSRATSVMKDRLHGYLLKIGTEKSTREAVALWEGSNCQERGCALLALLSCLVEQGCAYLAPGSVPAVAAGVDPAHQGPRTASPSSEVDEMDPGGVWVQVEGLYFCKIHGLEACPSCDVDFTEANGSAHAQPEALPAETSVNSSSGGSLDPRELEFIARKAMSQFEAAGDIIGRLYALIGLSHSQKAGRPLEEDKDMPGCALVLERAKAEALSVMRLVDKLMPWTWGRPANKARQEIQAASKAAELYFKVEGLENAKISSTMVSFRRDNIPMSRAMERATAGPLVKEVVGNSGAFHVPPAPPGMYQEIEAGVAKKVIAAELVHACASWLLSLAADNTARAGTAFSDSSLVSVPVCSETLTGVHDRQLNCLLQALSATVTATQLVKGFLEGFRVKDPTTTSSGSLRAAAADAEAAVLRKLLLDTMYPPFLMETSGNRAATLTKYFNDNFALPRKICLADELAKAASSLWSKTSPRDHVLDPNLAVAMWRAAPHFARPGNHRICKEFSAKLSSPRPQRSDMQKEFDEAFEEWPLPHENNPAINAGMLWAAAQQLKVRSTGHVGVHNVLYFLERCHLRDASQQAAGRLRLASEHYLELLELSAALVLLGLCSSDSSPPPVLLPLAYADSLVGCGLLETASDIKVGAWMEIPLVQMEELLGRLVRVCCHPHLRPMLNDPSVSKSAASYLRVRSALLLSLLACNMTVALQHAKTGGKDVIAPDLLQRLIEVLQRRLAGLAAEKLGEGDSAAEDVRQLLGATKVGDVARVVLKLAVSAGSSVLEVTAASTRPFDGWSAAQQPGTAHGKQGKDNRSAQAMAAAKAAHLAMSPAAWLKQPGAPILSSLPFSLWGFGCRTEESGAGATGDGVGGSSDSAKAPEQIAAALVIQAACRRHLRSRQKQAFAKRLRLWSPSFKAAVVACCLRIRAAKEEGDESSKRPRPASSAGRLFIIAAAQAHHLAELEAELDRSKRAALESSNYFERYSWVEGAIGALQDRNDAMGWGQCPVCPAGQPELSPHSLLGRQDPPCHVETSAHIHACYAFNVHKTFYERHICPSLSNCDVLEPLLATAQATARERGDAEWEHNCMVASEKVAELRQSISNKLAGIDRSHSWPDGMARSQLQAMVKELEGQCQQAYAWVADNSESAPSMADESQDIGGRKLTEELEDRLGIDDDDWELVTSRKKGRGRHQQGTGRGGGGGDGGARRRQPHHRQRQGGRNNRP